LLREVDDLVLPLRGCYDNQPCDEDANNQSHKLHYNARCRKRRCFS
jgi:hypothetical protein